MGLHHYCEYNCGATDCDAPEAPPREPVASDELLCISDFKKQIDTLAGEIGCDGKGIGSHNIRSSVTAYCPDTDEFYDIVEIEATTLPGCGCWDGIELILKKCDT